MRWIAIFLLTLFFTACVNHSKDSDDSQFLSENGEITVSVQLPDAPRWIDDSEQLFSKNQTDSLNQQCNSIFEQTGHMPMIHTVSNIEPYSSLNEYTNAIDLMWSDKGKKYFIILISKTFEEVRIIHGEVTESFLPADFTDMIMQTDMFPEFRENNYFTGITNALNRYLTILK